MTLEQISALAVAGESETLEFKGTTGTRREAASTVCAMLNQRGAHVLFGVTPTGDVALWDSLAADHYLSTSEVRLATQTSPSTFPARSANSTSSSSSTVDSPKVVITAQQDRGRF